MTHQTFKPLSSQPFKFHEDPKLTWCECLVCSVVTALIRGELKPGDVFPDTESLARSYGGHSQEIVDVIKQFLVNKILLQRVTGELVVHPNASPTMEMRRNAFISEARQLVLRADQWHIPKESMRRLFREVTR